MIEPPRKVAFPIRPHSVSVGLFTAAVLCTAVPAWTGSGRFTIKGPALRADPCVKTTKRHGTLSIRSIYSGHWSSSTGFLGFFDSSRRIFALALNSSLSRDSAFCSRAAWLFSSDRRWPPHRKNLRPSLLRLSMHILQLECLRP